MRLSNLFKIFGNRSAAPEGNQSTRSVEDILSSVAQRLGTADPRTKSQWQRLERTLFGSNDLQPAIEMPTARLYVRPAFVFAVATFIILVFGVVWLFRPSVRTYTTVRGEQMTLVLDDSSQVILNHTSQLTVTHTPLGKTRLVSLKGEAFFSVRHNGLPFVVRTETGTVRVLGTEFDVRERDNRMEVGVVHGSVQVVWTNRGTDSSVTLATDQIIACTRAGFVEPPATIPFPDYPGWVHGKLMFYRTNLASVCEELESRYNVHVALEGKLKRESTITGTIDNKNVESALLTLTQLTGSKYRRDGNTYTLY